MKLKKLEMQAFKSYENLSDGTFNFIENDSISNFISIYAPNGFGKTTFYDAIDYCLTNNIFRYVREKSLEKMNEAQAKSINQTGIKQHILRSKNVSDDIDSFVKLDTTVRSFERSVPKARANGRDFKFDEKNTDPEFKYFRDVLLSQEAIDAFLRENTPEQRYEKFVNSQLGGNLQHEKERVLIQSTLDKLSKSIEDGKRELGNLNEELQPTEATEMINNEIELLRNKLQDSIPFVPLLKEPISDAQVEQFEIFYKTSIANVFQQIQVHESKESRFNKYLDNFDSIKKLDSDILLTNQQIDNLIRENKKLRSISTKKKEEEFRLKNINTIEQSIKENESFLDNSADFIKYNTITSDVKFSKDKISEEINNLDKKKKYLVVERNKNLSENNQLEKKVETLKSDLNLSKIIFDKINKSELQIRDLKIRIQNSEVKIKDLSYESQRLIIQIKALKDFENNPLQELKNGGEIIDDELLKIKNIYIQSTKKKEELSKIRNLAENELESLSLYQSSLAKLVNLGLEIVADEKHSNCPLCEHQHGSFKNLNKAITDNSFLQESEKKIVSKINHIDKEIHIENEKLKKTKLELSDLIKKKVTGREQKNNKKCSSISELNKTNNIFNEELSKETNQLDSFNNKVLNQNEKGYVLYLNTQLKELESRITSNKDAITSLSAQIEKLNDEFEKSNLSKLSIEKKETPELSRLLSDMVSYFKIITDNVGQLTETNFVTKALVGRRTELERSFEAEKGLLVPIQNELSEQVSSYPNFDGKYFESSIEVNEGTIKSLQRDLCILEESYSEFRNFIFEFLDIEGKDGAKDWEKLSTNLKQSLENTLSLKQEQNELVNLINELKVKTDIGITYSKNNSIYKKIIQLKDKGEYLNEVKETLENDLKQINDYLKDNIENYFHTDLINTIYSKIDPHPEFKKIRFECEIKERGKPKLDVYITNDDGEIMAPNISFSSAQINVLSLSIFLAKALNTTDTNGKPVECILIDDPIQSMDAINVLGVIDLLRNISVNLDKQIIVSTHDDNFHSLLQQKIPTKLFNSKYFELESFGKVARSKAF